MPTGTITATSLRQEGNFIYINSLPATGVISITGYTDNATGESGLTQFNRTFRYSKNGIEWSEWQLLTTLALTSLSIATTDTLCLEFAYEKSQPLGTDTLNVTSVTVSTTEEVFVELPYFKDSQFAQYFQSNDAELLGWHINVLQKLYAPGIIAPFVSRLNSEGSPEDFISFWGAITRFFAYYVKFARVFQNFHEYKPLLTEYLEQRGLHTSIDNTLEQLQYLMRSYYKQMSKRGSIDIKKEGGNEGWGELLRLIYYVGTDEFLFNLHRPEHAGWWLGQCTPQHRGLYFNDNINKAFETGFDVTDLSKYPLTGTVTKVTDGDNSVMHINGSGGITPTGRYIKVDSNIDYEVSFLIKKSAGNTLTFKCIPYDADNNPLSCTSVSTSLASNFFLNGADLQEFDGYMFVKGMVYNYNLAPSLGMTMELNQGTDLIFPREATKIRIQIAISSGTANIYGVRILPTATPYSRGFIGVNNFISIWLRNRNNHFTFNQIEAEAIKLLLPYNSTTGLINIDEGYGLSALPQPCTSCPIYNGGTIYQSGGSYYASFAFDMTDGFGCPFKIYGLSSAGFPYSFTINSLADFTSNAGSIYSLVFLIGGLASLTYTIKLTNGYDCGIGGEIFYSVTTTTTLAPTTTTTTTHPVISTTTTAAPTTTTTTTVFCDGVVVTKFPNPYLGINAYFSVIYSGSPGSRVFNIEYYIAALGTTCNGYTIDYVQTNALSSGSPDSGTFSTTATTGGGILLPVSPNPNYSGGELAVNYNVTFTNCCGVVITGTAIRFS